MTLRSATFALFSVDFRKIFGNAVDFCVAALLQIAKTFTMKESFSSFRASVRSFRRAGGARVEKRSNRRSTRTSASREGARIGVNVKERRDLRR